MDTEEKEFDVYALCKDENPMKSLTSILENNLKFVVEHGENNILSLDGKTFYCALGKNYILLSNGVNKIQPVYGSPSNTEEKIVSALKSVIDPVMKGDIVDYDEFLTLKKGLVDDIKHKTGLDTKKGVKDGDVVYRVQHPKRFSTVMLDADASFIKRCTFDTSLKDFDGVTIDNINDMEAKAKIELTHRFENMRSLLKSLEK